MARIPRDAYKAALKKAKRWMKRDEVLAVGLGLRSRGGELIRDELCVVVTVRWKRRPQLLARRSEKPLPRHITVKHRNKDLTIPVDVENAHGRVAGKLHGIIATPLVATPPGSAKRHGMVGAVVDENGDVRIVTAGHVALTAGAQVTIEYPGGTLDGVATRVFSKGNMDHALIQPTDPLGPNAKTLPPGDKVAGVRDSTTVTEDEKVSFYDQDGDLHTAEVVKTGARVPFEMDGDVKEFDHLIGTPHKSREGDSGTLLCDDKLRAVGTLVGEFAGFDYFLPCDDSLDAMGVSLA